MQLKRSLTLGDAILLVVGNVVGAGIFTTSGFLAGELPQPFWFIGIWILGGLLTLCGALTYAELAGLFPRAGGDYQFLKEAYGAWAGFLLGWVNFWIIIPGSIAALSLALVSYLKPVLPGAGPGAGKPAALVVIALFTWVNYRGIRWGGTTQDFFTLGSLALLGVLVFGGLLFGKGSWQHFSGGPGGTIPWSKLLGLAHDRRYFYLQRLVRLHLCGQRSQGSGKKRPPLASLGDLDRYRPVYPGQYNLSICGPHFESEGGG